MKTVDTSAGWVKLHRCLKKNFLWKSEKFSKAQAWIDLILSANYEDSGFYVRGIWIDIKRGQTARSEISLAREWKWSRNRVRSFLCLLETHEMITTKKDNKTTIITICNYNDFQDLFNNNDTAKIAPQKQQIEQQNIDALSNDLNALRIDGVENRTANDTPKGTAEMQKTIQQKVQQTEQQIAPHVSYTSDDKIDSKKTAEFLKNDTAKPEKKVHKQEGIKEINNNIYCSSNEFNFVWEKVPKRNDRKQGKKSASVLFEKLSLEDKRKVYLGLVNYKKHVESTGQIAMDLSRFIRNRYFEDYLENQTEPAKRGLVL